jgi:hypothetical protein
MNASSNKCVLCKVQTIVQLTVCNRLTYLHKSWKKITILCRTKDGKPVEAGGRFRFLHEDEESLSLIIKGVTADDAGKYNVMAKNELGQDSVDMELLVQGE